MSGFIKQCIGIDCSKDSFHATLCTMDRDQEIYFTKVHRFLNNNSGFNQLLKWVRQNQKKDVPICYIMEATGVYYEPLAYHLYKTKKSVVVILPNKVKHFMKSLNVKTKNDFVDARAIAQIGVERKFNLWEPPTPLFLELRQLTRLHEQLQCQKVALQNMLHSKEFSQGTIPFVLKTNKKLIKSIETQIEKVEQAIQNLIEREDWLREKMERIQTIKGVGLMAAAVVIAETMGFKMIRNRKQLVSYAGYDVVERQSGTSVVGKTRISKKGNRHIRRALHFPALAASRFDEHHKNIYNRINERNDYQTKMVGAVALQRRLLLMIYALWKSDQVYDPQYQKSSL
ncbi:MAG: IS110 family transposase [Crocinitomicaceae bacterium]|jgi:transposase|nr:IS110 family transposase [Crocinitomicaceae bacterium]